MRTNPRGEIVLVVGAAAPGRGTREEALEAVRELVRGRRKAAARGGRRGEADGDGRERAVPGVHRRGEQ